VFKTVDKEKGDIKGAECANTSNLGNHQKRIRAIHDIFRAAGDPIAALLLADKPADTKADKGRKARQDILDKQFTAVDPAFRSDSTDTSTSVGGKDPLINTGDLTLKQICPYMEFLLRYADRRALGDVRWFLSVVDSARAGVKMT
jgi:hypothetical protein